MKQQRRLEDVVYRSIAREACVLIKARPGSFKAPVLEKEHLPSVMVHLSNGDGRLASQPRLSFCIAPHQLLVE